MQNPENQKIDYRVETWPKWAQREFGIQFWGQYVLRLIAAKAQGKSELAENNTEWANKIYERTHARASSASAWRGTYLR
jgi:hypothetical protein